MAKKDKKGDLATVQRNSDELQGILTGRNRTFSTEIDQITSEIRASMKKVSSFMKDSTGNEMTEFFARLSQEKRRSRNGGKEDALGKIFKKTKDGKVVIDANEMVDGSNKNLINDIFHAEQDRIKRYESYDQIYELIPQMAMVLNTYRDNIISPDDFTKNTFGIEYPEDAEKKTREFTEQVIKRYDLRKKVDKIILESLKKGDYFVARIPYRDTVLKYLDTQEQDKLGPNNLLRESFFEDLGVPNVSLTEGDISVLDAMLRETGNEDEVTTAQWTTEMNQFLGDSLLFTNDPTSMLSEEAELLKEASESAKKKMEDMDLNGSILKMLDPAHVVKLELDGICYGYYHVDQVVGDQFGSKSSAHSRLNSILAASNIGKDEEKSKLAKYNLITDLFIRHASEKMDKKFITKNPEFRDIIHSVISRQDDLRDGVKPIKITYFPPEQVYHFESESVFAPILFTAKLYLATLTSTLMQKLVRAPEKRIFYIETGLEEDVPGSVNSFIKSIKAKEFKASDLGDISTALQVVGTFNDLYVPTQNGEKPIEVDTLQGTDVSIENEFLEYLRKTMISGSGVPASLLGYTDEVEFARSLTMQNGRFVRAVVRWQMLYGEVLSDLLRDLIDDEKKDDDIDSEGIRAKFPKPSTLSAGYLSEQMGTVDSVIEGVMRATVGDDQGDESDKDMRIVFRRKLMEEYLPGIDWERVDNLLAEAKKEATRKALVDKIKKGNTTSSEEEDAGGGW